MRSRGWSPHDGVSALMRRRHQPPPPWEVAEGVRAHGRGMVRRVVGDGVAEGPRE